MRTTAIAIKIEAIVHDLLLIRLAKRLAVAVRNKPNVAILKHINT